MANVRVVIQSKGSKVGIMQLNNRCVRERVGSKFSAINYDMNSKIMKWLVRVTILGNVSGVYSRVVFL